MYCTIEKTNLDRQHSVSTNTNFKLYAWFLKNKAFDKKV